MDRFVKFPIENGIKPVRLFSANEIAKRDVNFPISCGMVPERELF